MDGVMVSIDGIMNEEVAAVLGQFRDGSMLDNLRVTWNVGTYSCSFKNSTLDQIGKAA